MIKYTLKSGEIIPAFELKMADEYSQDDINSMLSSARNQFEYDNLIDRLYLRLDNCKKYSKNRCQHSFLTARRLYEREKQCVRLSEYLT